jgi:hypothetical protein
MDNAQQVCHFNKPSSQTFRIYLIYFPAWYIVTHIHNPDRTFLWIFPDTPRKFLGMPEQFSSSATTVSHLRWDHVEDGCEEKSSTEYLDL